jgi:sugar-specific transcriptional regulator TrmB
MDVLTLRRTRETIELNERANRLMEKFEEKNRRILPVEESQFILITEGETLARRAQKMIEDAEETISLVMPRRRIGPYVAHNFEFVKNALERNVAVRLITERFQENKATEIQELKKFGLFEIGYAVTEPRVVFALIDNREVLLITSAEVGYSESPAVWSNNPGLIELAQGYFELTWSTLPATKMTQ